jgi:hypothetical protein
MEARCWCCGYAKNLSHYGGRVYCQACRRVLERTDRYKDATRRIADGQDTPASLIRRLKQMDRENGPGPVLTTAGS